VGEGPDGPELRRRRAAGARLSAYCQRGCFSVVAMEFSPVTKLGSRYRLSKSPSGFSKAQSRCKILKQIEVSDSTDWCPLYKPNADMRKSINRGVGHMVNDARTLQGVL